jgi:hypothetical protein
MRFSLPLCAVLYMVLSLQGCDLFKPRPDVLAEVADSELTLAKLRATVPPGDTLDRAQWSERVQYWVERELLYREAKARGLHKDRRVAELIAIAERKILVDQLLQQMDSSLGDVTDGEMAQYFEAHADLFRRDRDVWTVAKVQFPSMQVANDYVKLWSPVQSERLISGQPGILPVGATLQTEVAGAASDTCWSRDVRLFQRKQLSTPRVCSGQVLSFMLVDRLDSGSVLTFPEVRPRLRNMVLEERRAQKMAKLLTDAKNRYTVFSYPEALDSLAPKD